MVVRSLPTGNLNSGHLYHPYLIPCIALSMDLTLKSYTTSCPLLTVPINPYGSKHWCIPIFSITSLLCLLHHRGCSPNIHSCFKPELAPSPHFTSLAGTSLSHACSLTESTRAYLHCSMLIGCFGLLGDSQASGRTPRTQFACKNGTSTSQYI